MKKELLLATTIAGITLGATSASAVTATFSGNHRVGIEDEDKDSTTATSGTTNENRKSSFAVALEETLDSGTKIAGSFSLMSESSTFNYTGASGITLTFTDGSSLGVLYAAGAHKSHDVAIPGASGEQGITGLSSNSAKLGIDAVGGKNNIGVAWHSAADVAGVEGLSVSLSFSNGDEADVSGNTIAIDSSMAAGATYVTTSGDTTVTLGAGVLGASDNNVSSRLDTDVYHLGVTAVNGDLTVGAGMGAGDYGHDLSSTMQEVADWESVEIGVKYVSGDFTLTASSVDAEATDNATMGGTPSGSADDASKQAVSVDYAVASGVTATLGYANIEQSNEGAASKANSGTAWYIGTNLSF